jgi:AraC-like DNA-binding protein
VFTGANHVFLVSRPLELGPLSLRDTKLASRDIRGDKNRPRFIRSGLLIAYADATGSLGLDPYRMMRKVGLPVVALENPNLKIPVDRVQALLAESARAGVCEEFGLLVGRAFKLSMKGALGSLIREQPTVRAGVEALKRYLRYQNDNVEIGIDERDGLAVIEPVLLSQRTQRDRQMVEMTVAMKLQILRALLGEAWMPVRVTFVHDPPKNPRPYRDNFGAVQFNQPINSIVLSSTDLDTALPDADAEMAREIARYIEGRAKPASGAVADTMSDLISRLLPTGHCGVDEVASQLGIDRRTVHRRLAGEGQSFTQLLDTARRAVATEELSRGDQPLSVVMRQAGFSSPSSFSRWFHQAYGIQPSEFRRLAQRI